MSYEWVNNIPQDYVWSFKMDWNWKNNTWSNNAIVTNWTWIDAIRGYQKGQLSWGASTSFTYSSITYTNSYIWIDWVFTKNSIEVTTTSLNWTSWKTYSWLIFFNRTLTTNEEFSLKMEWLKHLWEPILQQYPELFEWVVWYWDFKDWNVSNLINWVNATNVWTTSVTDHLGNSNSARSFNGSSNYISMPSWTSVSWSSPRTLNLWIKKTSSTTIRTLYESWTTNTEQLFRLHTSAVSANDVYIAFDYSDYYTNWNVINNWVWTNICVVYDWWILSTSTVHIYINWISQSLTKAWLWTWTANTAVWISYFWQDSWTRYFDWIIDSVLLSSKALSADNVKLLYNITSKKYIYPFASYTPASLPKPVLHIDWTNDWTTWYDQSGNGNNWTGINVTMSRQNQNDVMLFNGSSKIIVPLNVPNSYTISLKFKASDLIWNEELIAKDDGVTRCFSYELNTNVVNFYTWNSSWAIKIVSSSVIEANRIYHFILTWDSVWNYICYQDWVPSIWINNVTTWWNAKDSAKSIYIGSREWVWNESYLTWAIYTPKIYNQVLTPEQVQQEYYASYN